MWNKLLLFLLLAAPLQAQAVAVRLQNSLLDSLDVLADGATTEHIRCLTGGLRGDTLFVVDLYEPAVKSADSNNVVYEGCDKARTIVVWHNHIYDAEMHGSPVARCFLSPADVTTALREGIFIWAVQVDRNTTCWWTYPQIIVAAQLRMPVLWPLNGQVGRIPRGEP